MTWQTTTNSLEETVQLGADIGAHCRGGEVIELVSDLGGGKTTFVHGLAQGLGSTDKVASPSFTISREYNFGDKTLYHFDFYRLSDPGLVANELSEVLGDPKAVVVVEWADIVGDVLPTERLTIQIKNTGETQREFTYSYPEALNYLIKKDT